MPAALLLLVQATTPVTLAAQDPPPRPPPDTVALPDTIAAPADTVPPEPPPPFVPIAATRFTHSGAAVWRWDRAALLTEVAISLADLLERVPGLDVLRAGTYLQPEAARALGGTSDRVEIVFDGFVLDPLDAAALDIATIRLVQLAEVVVERRLDVLRVHLKSEESLAAEPYSRVEAMLGIPSLNVFRGVLLAPNLAFGPFAAAVERVETDGRVGIEPADVFETWAKWGWLREDYGVQAELRRYTLNRRTGSPWPTREERQDVILRGRARPTPGAAAEAYFGRSVQETFALPRQDTVPGLERQTSQAGVRARYDASLFGARGALRWRSHDALPSLHADVGGSIAIGTAVELDAELTHSAWRRGTGRTGGRLYAGISPLAGVRVFGEAAAGERAVPVFLPPLVTDTIDENGDVADGAGTGITSSAAGVGSRAPRAALDDEAGTAIGAHRTAFRAGASIERWGAVAAAALLRVDSDSVPAFRMPFDATLALLPGGATNGVEAWARVPIPRTAFALEGSVVSWFGGSVAAYQPQRSWRTALTLHASPLESGNLQIIGRGEAYHRGAYLAPQFEQDGTAALAVVPGTTGVSGSLHIRIIDVHIVGRYENLGARMGADLPGRPPPGARFYYGVKWSFWN